jgi:hypothetical protein
MIRTDWVVRLHSRPSARSYCWPGDDGIDRFLQRAGLGRRPGRLLPGLLELGPEFLKLFAAKAGPHLGEPVTSVARLDEALAGQISGQAVPLTIDATNLRYADLASKEHW